MKWLYLFMCTVAGAVPIKTDTCIIIKYVEVRNVASGRASIDYYAWDISSNKEYITHAQTDGQRWVMTPPQEIILQRASDSGSYRPREIGAAPPDVAERFSLALNQEKENFRNYKQR